MLHKQLCGLKIASVLSLVAIIQGSAVIQAQTPPKNPNAIVIGGGQVQFPNNAVQAANNQPMNAVQQNFQRELARLRRAERKKVSPEARKRAADAYADLNIRMSYYVDNARDASKRNLNANNRLLFGDSARRNITTNDVRNANGLLPKSGDPYVDMANDTISVQIKRILAENPGRSFTMPQILARIVHQIDVSMKPENIQLLANQLSVLDFHLEQLISSGYVRKKEADIIEMTLKTDDKILIKRYLGYVYSAK